MVDWDTQVCTADTLGLTNQLSCERRDTTFHWVHLDALTTRASSVQNFSGRHHDRVRLCRRA